MRQAEHNEKFVNHFDINSTIFLDWVVTGIFYSALHYIDGYLATKNLHLKGHIARDNYVYKVSDLRQIYGHYRTLKDDSEDARYDVRGFQSQEVNQLIANEFNTIKNHIIDLLKSP